MDKKSWERMEAIIDDALELDCENREPYISRRCKGNRELYHMTIMLLEAIYQARDDHFLEK